MLEKIKKLIADPEVKRWFISSVITFLSGFFLIIGAEFKDLSVEKFSIAALIGILVIGMLGLFTDYLSKYLHKKLEY